MVRQVQIGIANLRSMTKWRLDRELDVDLMSRGKQARLPASCNFISPLFFPLKSQPCYRVHGMRRSAFKLLRFSIRRTFVRPSISQTSPRTYTTNNAKT
jgi:hypothetical protein